MRGPCAKRQILCIITTQYGRRYGGENDCANPQTTCPRLPGEGYEKCKTICQQDGHAELQALAAAKEENAYLQGASAFIRGHYYICEPCGKALRDAGIGLVEIANG